MCRWFALISVNPILLDDVLIRPKNAITQQILAHWQGTAVLNADGFGITWHTDARSNFNPYPPAQKDESELQTPEAYRTADLLTDPVLIGDGPFVPFVCGPHPAIYKTTIAKPLNDPVFNSLCANVSSRTIFAHLRAAGAPPVATTNNHPFVFGRHCFMHNGGIVDFKKIRKHMMNETSDGFISMLEGGTDTEHLAALYLTYLCSPPDFRGADKHYNASEMWTALQAAIHTVERIQTEHKIVVDNFLNICTTDGESMLALCYRSESGLQTPPFTLWLSTNVADTLDRKPYAMRNGRIFEDTRSDEQVEKATHDLVQHAKPVMQPVGPEANSPMVIHPVLLESIKSVEHTDPTHHGPHVVVASEPTTIDPNEWYQLENRQAVLVDTVWKEDIQTTVIKPGILERLWGYIFDAVPNVGFNHLNPVYTGKLNYSPYASNENIIVDLPDGWVTHGRARVWSTWTKDASGVPKSLSFGPALTAYVLRDVSDDATTFMIRDLDNKNYYWFTGTRQGDSITLSLLNSSDVVCQSNITLTSHV